MTSQPNPATSDRDLRLFLFLGIANWSIFLDHIPDNVVNWITARNYGFSGAADLFIFIAGYNAAIIYPRIMRERGTIVGLSRIIHRVWQLYAAYLVLFVIYIVVIGSIAARYAAPELFSEFKVSGLIDHSLRILAHGLFLQTKALNLDVLQLYIFLLLFFAPLLWLMIRQPTLIAAASLALYVAARRFGWNLPSYPDGDWYFNPLCWQLLFIFGAWVALDRADETHPIFRSTAALWIAIAYLAFALVVTLAGRLPEFGSLFPARLLEAFNPNDKTNLAPYRVLHFAAGLLVVTRFVPRNWPGLTSRICEPLIICGEQSLAVFCVGVFLSFIGHFVLSISAKSVMLQILVSVTGIAIMTVVAYYITWSKQQDAWKTAAAPEQPATLGRTQH